MDKTIESTPSMQCIYIRAKAIICKSSLLNDNKALENDAIAFEKIVLSYASHM